MPENKKKDIYFTVVFSLSLVTVFSLGYFTANITKLSKPPISVEKISSDSDNNKEPQNFQEGEVVASVNSDKYHFLYCPGAKSIKEENKIYFQNAQEAILAGFVLAGNCK